MEQQIEQLESRAAFTEMGLEQLSDIVYQQQKAIDSLQLQIRQLQEKLNSIREAEGTFLDHEPPPPHY